MTLLSLSAIGEYVARIYEESKSRPLYILDHMVNVRAGEIDQVATVRPRAAVVASHALMPLREKVGISG
jgi:hypothetical protein